MSYRGDSYEEWPLLTDLVMEKDPDKLLNLIRRYDCGTQSNKTHTASENLTHPTTRLREFLERLITQRHMVQTRIERLQDILNHTLPAITQSVNDQIGDYDSEYENIDWDMTKHKMAAELAAYEDLVKRGGRPAYPKLRIDEVTENYDLSREMGYPWSHIVPYLDFCVGKFPVFQPQLKRWNEFRRSQYTYRDIPHGETYEDLREELQHDMRLKRGLMHDKPTNIMSNNLRALEREWDRRENDRSSRAREFPGGFRQYCARGTKALADFDFTCPFTFHDDPEKQDALTTWVEYLFFEIRELTSCNERLEGYQKIYESKRADAEFRSVFSHEEAFRDADRLNFHHNFQEDLKNNLAEARKRLADMNKERRIFGEHVKRLNFVTEDARTKIQEQTEKCRNQEEEVRRLDLNMENKRKLKKSLEKSAAKVDKAREVAACQAKLVEWVFRELHAMRGELGPLSPKTLDTDFGMLWACLGDAPKILRAHEGRRVGFDLEAAEPPPIRNIDVSKRQLSTRCHPGRLLKRTTDWKTARKQKKMKEQAKSKDQENSEDQELSEDQAPGAEPAKTPSPTRRRRPATPFVASRYVDSSEDEDEASQPPEDFDTDSANVEDVEPRGSRRAGDIEPRDLNTSFSLSENTRPSRSILRSRSEPRNSNTNLSSSGPENPPAVDPFVEYVNLRGFRRAGGVELGDSNGSVSTSENTRPSNSTLRDPIEPRNTNSSLSGPRTGNGVEPSGSRQAGDIELTDLESSFAISEDTMPEDSILLHRNELHNLNSSLFSPRPRNSIIADTVEAEDTSLQTPVRAGPQDLPPTKRSSSSSGSSTYHDATTSIHGSDEESDSLPAAPVESRGSGNNSSTVKNGNSASSSLKTPVRPEGSNIAATPSRVMRSGNVEPSSTIISPPDNRDMPSGLHTNSPVVNVAGPRNRPRASAEPPISSPIPGTVSPAARRANSRQRPVVRNTESITLPAVEGVIAEDNVVEATEPRGSPIVHNTGSRDPPAAQKAKKRTKKDKSPPQPMRRSRRIQQLEPTGSLEEQPPPAKRQRRAK